MPLIRNSANVIPMMWKICEKRLVDGPARLWSAGVVKLGDENGGDIWVWVKRSLTTRDHICNLVIYEETALYPIM